MLYVPVCMYVCINKLINEASNNMHIHVHTYIHTYIYSGTVPIHVYMYSKLRISTAAQYTLHTGYPTSLIHCIYNNVPLVPSSFCIFNGVPNVVC